MIQKEDLLSKEDLYPILELEAKSKGLKVFHFNNEELKEDFNTKHPEIEVLVIARNSDSARFNLKNMRYSYLIKK